MKQNWVLTAAVLAILAVPFGLALFEDATRETPEGEGEDEGDDIAESELETELPPEDPPVDETADDVVAWERSDIVDITPVLDQLSAGEVGFRGELDRAVMFGSQLSDVARRYEARFNASYGPDLTLAIEPDPNLYTTGPVVSVSFGLAENPGFRARLVDRWGQPDSGSADCSVWTDEDRRVRAALKTATERWSLVFGDYRELSSLLEGRAGGAFGFEPSPLVGASIDAIKSRHREILVADEVGDPTYTLLVTPPPASREPTLPITLIAPSGRVDEISATIDLGCDRRARARATAALSSQLGRVIGSARIGEATELRFEDRPDVSAFVYSDRLVLVRRAR